MKKISKIFASVFLTLMFSIASINLYAQAPGGVPSDPSISGSNGAVGHPVGAGATLAGGLYILLLLGGVYGTYKLYDIRQKKVTLDEKGLAEGE